jgi:hypothetical protein
MTPPTILFFARGYQADYFPTLVSDRYNAVFVTLTRNEKQKVESRGCKVAACFEEDFASLLPCAIPANYLATSFPADRFLGRYGAKMRQEILGKEIRFWRQLLETHKPKAVVNELVALEISEVLLQECRSSGILYLAGMNCVVEDYFYWLTDPLTLSGARLSLREPDEQARTLAAAYVREVKARDYKPFYVKDLAGRRDLRPICVGLVRWLQWGAKNLYSRLTGNFRYEMYDDEYAKRLLVYFKGWFLRYDSLADIPADQEVIFYPLHQEPEATLNYMSEFYANQVATIENILKCLKPNQVLIVKEHPVDKGALLLRKFQKIRQDNSSLYFLPAELHGREVLQRASQVVTLTSTLGWEAAILGVPVHVLGQIFYDVLPGLEQLTGFEALRDRLRGSATVATASQELIEDFVARMTAGSYPGNPFPNTALYSDQNRTRIIEAICDAVSI